MVSRWLLLCLCIGLSSCQYDSMRADVTFTNYNDRFDVGDIINEQNRQFKDLPQTMDYEDTRRHAPDLPLVDVLKRDRRRYQRSNQDARRFAGSEEEFVHSWQPRMVDRSEELDKYNTNLENFRRQKPPQIVSRRFHKGVNVQALDNVKTYDNPNEDLQGVIVDSKTQRRSDPNTVKSTKPVETKQDMMPKNYNGVPIVNFIDTKGRRNNRERTRRNIKQNDDNQNMLPNKDMQGVILKYLHGGKDLINGRRMSETKAGDDDVLLNYAVPLRMTIKGYVELPNV